MNIYEPHNEDDRRNNQPATKGDVRVAVNTLRQELPEIVTGAIKPIIKDKFDEVKEEMASWKDEILTREDKVIKKLDQVLTEQQAITVNYKRLDQQVDNLIDFAERAAEKLNIDFERA